MKTTDKIELVRLLSEYQAEKAAENVARKKDQYGCVIPTKSLFTHARVIQTRLSVEIEKELKSSYQV